MERGYNEKMILKQILRAQEYSRNNLLKREKPQMPEQKITFKITYHPGFQNIRKIMEELHKHRKVFPNVSAIGFWNGKSLEDYLVRAT